MKIHMMIIIAYAAAASKYHRHGKWEKLILENSKFLYGLNSRVTNGVSTSKIKN